MEPRKEEKDKITEKYIHNVRTAVNSIARELKVVIRKHRFSVRNNWNCKNFWPELRIFGDVFEKMTRMLLT